MCIDKQVLRRNDKFKYFGFMIHKDGGVEDDFTHYIKAGVDKVESIH